MRTTPLLLAVLTLTAACEGTRFDSPPDPPDVPVPPACTAQTCSGCCLDGVCVRTTTAAYCGAGGQACFACGSGQRCGSYGRCEAIGGNGALDTEACTMHLLQLPSMLDRPLTAVWAGATTAWGVGPMGALVLENDRFVPPPGDASIGVGLKAVWSRGDGQTVWLVRADVGAALRRELPALGLDEPSPTGAELNAIWGRSDSDVWVAGAAGRLAHWDGRSWAIQQAGSEAFLGLAGNPQGPVYASTATQLYRELNGVFELLTVAPGRLTGAITPAGADAVWAAGEGGALHHFEAGAWRSTHIGAASLGGLWAQARTTLFFTQPHGIGFRAAAGASFVSFAGLGLTAISGTAPNRAVAVGVAGAVLARCARPDELSNSLPANSAAGGAGVYCHTHCVQQTAQYGCIGATTVCH
ncbi:MAG: hypothetical protein JNK82_09505 [Myxococcaceae bacterium]|nr:hypothetical protein [Myxococcaceae bacterium]